MDDLYLKKGKRTVYNCNKSDDRQGKPEEGRKDYFKLNQKPTIKKMVRKHGP